MRRNSLHAGLEIVGLDLVRAVQRQDALDTCCRHAGQLDGAHEPSAVPSPRLGDRGQRMLPFSEGSQPCPEMDGYWQLLKRPCWGSTRPVVPAQPDRVGSTAPSTVPRAFSHTAATDF